MFLAKDLEFSEASPEGTESMKVIKVPMKQALEWVMDSTITHGGTVALILKAQKYLL